MKIKDRLIIIIAILVVIVLCILYPSKQIYFEGDKNINKIMSYSFSYNDNQNIDHILKYQKYIYLRESYENHLADYLAIIVCQENKAYLNQYKIYYTEENEIRNGEINIIVPNNSKFIISLPNNEETYEWSIKNGSSLVEFKKKSRIEINCPKEDYKKFARENLYFTTQDKGKDVIEVRYNKQDQSVDKSIVINITIK